MKERTEGGEKHKGSIQISKWKPTTQVSWVNEYVTVSLQNMKGRLYLSGKFCLPFLTFIKEEGILE